jgi:hypothetical protein
MVVLASGVSGFQSWYLLFHHLGPFHVFNIPVLFHRVTLHQAGSIVFIFRLSLSTLILKNDILYIYIYMGGEATLFTC